MIVSGILANLKVVYLAVLVFISAIFISCEHILHGLFSSSFL